MMAGKSFYWLALMIAVAANISANIALKMAVTSVAPHEFKVGIYQLMGQVSFWVGLVSAVVLLVSYLIAIKTLPVSVAYVSVTSLAVVGLVVAEKWLFGVPLGIYKLLGIVFVIAGVWLITQSGVNLENQ